MPALPRRRKGEVDHGAEGCSMAESGGHDMRDCCTEIMIASGERFNSDPCEWTIDEIYTRTCKAPMRNERWYWEQSFLKDKVFIPTLDDISIGWVGRRGDRQFWIEYYAMWIHYLDSMEDTP
jgi:hypothetical protein